jgi:hypothetical protein
MESVVRQDLGFLKDGGFNTLCGDIAAAPLQADCIESVQLPCVEARSFPKAGCGP